MASEKPTRRLRGAERASLALTLLLTLAGIPSAAKKLRAQQASAEAADWPRSLAKWAEVEVQTKGALPIRQAHFSKWELPQSGPKREGQRGPLAASAVLSDSRQENVLWVWSSTEDGTRIFFRAYQFGPSGYRAHLGSQAGDFRFNSKTQSYVFYADGPTTP